jgi:hypothetical protein
MINDKIGRKTIYALIIIALLGLNVLLTALLDSCQSRANRIGADDKPIVLDPAISRAVKVYLDKMPSHGDATGKMFWAYKVLGFDGSEQIKHLYLWLLDGWYGVEGVKVVEGGGISGPVALDLRKKAGKYEVVSEKTPGDGNLYQKDIEKIFPLEVQQNKLLSGGDAEFYNNELAGLQKQIIKDVKAYFKDYADRVGSDLEIDSPSALLDMAAPKKEDRVIKSSTGNNPHRY